jgi:hypothetical protein
MTTTTNQADSYLITDEYIVTVTNADQTTINKKDYTEKQWNDILDDIYLSSFDMIKEEGDGSIGRKFVHFVRSKQEEHSDIGGNDSSEVEITSLSELSKFSKEDLETIEASIYNNQIGNEAVSILHKGYRFAYTVYEPVIPDDGRRNGCFAIKSVLHVLDELLEDKPVQAHVTSNLVDLSDITKTVKMLQDQLAELSRQQCGFATDPREITYQEFEEKYRPITDEHGWKLFETTDEIVKAIKPNHIWTTVQCDDNELGTYAGWRAVNRLNYLVTEIPHNFDVVFYEEMANEDLEDDEPVSLSHTHEDELNELLADGVITA